MFSCAVTSVARLFSAFSLFHHQHSGMRAVRAAGAAAMGATVCLLAGMPLAAQTAHFSDATSTLQGGFNNPVGVAMDGERKHLCRRQRKQRGEGNCGGGRLYHCQHPGQRIPRSPLAWRWMGAGTSSSPIPQQRREGDCGGGRLHYRQYPGQRIPRSRRRGGGRERKRLRRRSPDTTR